MTFTPQDGSDFSTVQASVTVNVSASQSALQVTMNAVNITYGTALDNAQLSGTASVLFNGQTVNVPGSFAYTTAAGAVLGAGQGQVEQVTFTPNDSVDYSSAQTTVKVNVYQATPQLAVNPVNFTYGTVFANSQLSGTATATVNGQEINVAGHFTYTNSAFIGSVLGAGQFSGIGVTFTPNDTTDFQTVQTNVTVNVARATPQVAVNPVTIIYGTALTNSQLSGTATATVGGVWLNISGSFTYTSAAGSLLHAGTQTITVTFTPADNTDFATVTTTVQVVIKKATPTITWPTPAPIKYGTALSSTQLDARANVAGTYSYSLPAGTILKIGLHTLTVTFTPTDTTDFNSVVDSVQLTVLD